MTSLDKNGVTVYALGEQKQSARKSAPIWSLSKAGREAREGMYITEEHIRTQKIGRESPKGGFLYDQPSTLNKATTNFGFGGRTDFTKNNNDPDDIDTNAALDVLPDAQLVKYRRNPKIIIGTEPRGKLKDAELLKAHGQAFYGRQSPGPAAIGEDGGPNFKGTKERMSPARPFGIKAKLNWGTGDNPPEVGPGRHERKDVSLGTQHLSHRRTQSVNAIARSERFPKARIGDETISVLDSAKTCLGKQVLGKNRSEPSIGFGTGSRDGRSRTHMCMTKADAGPAGEMGKVRFNMPRLPQEKVIMAHGMG